MITIRWASLLICVLCLVLTFARMTVDGISVLAVVMSLIFTWSFGAFTRAFWDAAPPPAPRQRRR